MAERVQSGPQQSRARRCSGAAQRTLDGEDRSERITGGRKGSLIPAYSPTKIPEFPLMLTTASFERRMFGSNPEQLRSLAAWKPVWGSLERYWKPLREKREGARRKSGTLHLAQAQSNRGPRGRKKDFPDAERLVKRLVARELTLSFVPDAEQRLWRTVKRRKDQLTRDRVRLQNQVESLLEEAHIKLSSLVSDLLGASSRRMLQALAEGETNPATLAALAHHR